jgi:hypothetical protein
MPQMRSVKVVTLPDKPHERIVTYEGSPSPRELLENVVIQAEAALKGLASTKRNVDAGRLDDEEERRVSMVEAARREKEKQEEMKHDQSAQLREFW